VEQSRNILKKFWGYEVFRPLQEDIVDASIYGNDVLALLPTGGGKSICFQVPGIAREGICIVISPLIALMHDQVEQLQKRGIRAKAITSGMSYREIDITLDNAKFGGLDFLYTSPERLKTTLFIERFKQMNVGLIVVDEAHCISEWGHDFRPPYREIHLLRELHPEVPFIALTATATPEVKKDIIEQLKLKKPTVFEGAFQRPNLSYEVYPVENKSKAISQLVKRFEGMCGIIYCQRRKSVKEVAQWLMAQGNKVGIYHGGMDAKSRSEMMLSWMKDHVNIMVATNAFGMGIDKPNVRFVAHYEFPNNPEAYFQEAGRAGRDGLESRTFVFYEPKDLLDMDQQIEQQFPPIPTVKRIYNALGNYLKLAVGSGEGETFPVELKELSSTFNLDLLECYQALKILETNGNLLFTESVFHPTKVKFAVGNTVLYSFQISYDSTSNLITLLSRSYPGIFDQYQEIHEKEFCKRLQINAEELNKQLKFLEANGILDISWKTDLPLVTYIEPRLADDYLRLKPEIYQERKKLAELRWQRMRHLLTKPVCRAQYLIEYFGQESEKCGKCDFCISQQKGTYSQREMENMILTILSSPKSLYDLQGELNSIPKNDILRTIQYLLQEERIAFEKDFYKRIN
jgi:ATP-dependent DNA helicase RecQ